jgi:hypothetical protein
VYDQLQHDNKAKEQLDKRTYYEAILAYKQLGDTAKLTEIATLMQQLQ